MTKLLNRDMIEECINEFNKRRPHLNENEKAKLIETDVKFFSVHALHFIYLFRWDGTAFSGSKDYCEDELERLFKAKLNSVDDSHVTAPNHYILPSGKQLIELLQSDLLTRKEFIGFCKGNVYKYVSRYQFKNHREDLEKAKQYLNFLEALDNGQSENE